MAKLAQDRLTRQEVDALVAAAGGSSTGRRNAALIMLAADAGLRVGEIRQLRLKDIDLDTGRVVVQNGKGGKRRTSALSGTGRVVVRAWLERRKHLQIPGAVAICTLSGSALGGSYARGMLPRLARRAGIEKRVHPHGLRHFAACSWHDEGAPLGTISTLLGHKALSTTSVYLKRLGADEAISWAAARR